MAGESCPKCQGPRDAKALYCPFCGVVFARYVAESIPTPATNPLPAAPSPFRTAPAAMSPASPFLAAPATASATAFPATMAPRMAATVYGGDLPPEAEATWNPYQGPRTAGPLSAAGPQASGYAEQATRGSRLAAQMLNGLYMWGTIIFCGAIGYIPGSMSADPANAWAGAFLAALFGLVLLAISNIRQLRETGQSLGKKRMSIKIVGLAGEKPTLSCLLIRRFLALQLLGAIPLIGPFVGLANVLAIFGSEQRCLHDHIADTVVVKC